MWEDERPDEVKPLNGFQRWVAQALEPLPQPLRLVLVGIVCLALVALPLILFLSG
jgi:hypothetical protein